MDWDRLFVDLDMERNLLSTLLHPLHPDLLCAFITLTITLEQDIGPIWKVVLSRNFACGVQMV